jgi:hypothetical protein
MKNLLGFVLCFASLNSITKILQKKITYYQNTDLQRMQAANFCEMIATWKSLEPRAPPSVGGSDTLMRHMCGCEALLSDMWVLMK